jgi:hypothetical protein
MGEQHEVQQVMSWGVMSCEGSTSGPHSATLTAALLTHTAPLKGR